MAKGKDKNVREKELMLEYLKANNYSLHSKSGYMTWYYWVHKDYPSTEYKKEYNSTRFNIEGSSLNIVGSNEFSAENIKKTYLNQKWTKNCINDKDYYKEIDYLINGHRMDDVIDFIEQLPATENEKVKLIENLPVSILEAYNTTFNKIKNIIDKSNYSEEDKAKFYVKFFKARKNQLTGITGESAEKFLIALYGLNEVLLTPYFDFFSNIKNKFKDIELDIEEPGNVVFSQRFNLRKAAKILEGVDESKVKDWITKFSANMAKQYQLWSDSEIVDKPKGIIEIRFYKRTMEESINEKMNLTYYNQKVKEFLVHISGLSEEPNINFNYIEKWLLQSDLTKKLESKTLESENKNKPKKI